MRKVVLLDTQLIVLLVVGLTATEIIGKHKNLTAYGEDDFELLLLLLGAKPRLAFLPNTLSEASNLLRQHRDPERSRILATFRELIETHREHYVRSREAVALPGYDRLGLADCAIITGCRSRWRLLTADLDLFLVAQRSGIEAANFHHSREEFGLL